MFNISIPELLIVFAVLLLFVGPDKLPDAARKIGSLMAQFRRGADQLRRDFYNSAYPPSSSLPSSKDSIASNPLSEIAEACPEEKLHIKVDLGLADPPEQQEGSAEQGIVADSNSSSPESQPQSGSSEAESVEADEVQRRKESE